MEEKNQPRRPRRAPEEQTRNESLVYGKNPVTELLKSGSGVDTVLISESMAPAVAAYYTALAKEAGAAVKRVNPNKLRLMTGTESHQGVAAFASEIAYATVEDLLAAAKAKGEPPFLVLSDGIEDPHNLGAVMRSALLCGAHGIVIPKRGGPRGQHRRDHPPPQGAGRIRVLCRHGRRAPAQEQPHRPHRAGAGQRGQRRVAAGQEVVRRCGAAGHGRTGHRCGQLQRLGGGRHYPVRDPVAARSTECVTGVIRNPNLKNGRNKDA